MAIHENTKKLQEQILNYIKANTPIKCKDGSSVTLESLAFKNPDAIDSISEQLKMKYTKEGSLEGWLRGRIVIRDAKGKEISKSGVMNLISIPYETERNTFLINGTEKQIMNQMRLKPGSYTENDQGKTKTLMLFSNSGKKFVPQIIVDFNSLNDDFKVHIKTKPVFNIDGIQFLKEMGFSEGEIRSAIGNASIADALFKKGGRGGKTINDIYKAIVGKNNTSSPDVARNELYMYLAENARFGTGAPVIQNNLNMKPSEATHLSKDVIIQMMKKTFAVSDNRAEQDEKDDIRFKDVLNTNDLIFEQVKTDIDKFIEESKEKVESENKSKLNASTFAPVLKLGNSLKTFMGSSSVQAPEETNPLFVAAISKKITQDISEKAAKQSPGARNLSITGINKVDPVETPESGKVGLVQHLTQSAVIKDKNIHVPVYRVNHGVISTSSTIELSTMDDWSSIVAYHDTRYISEDKNGKLKFTKDIVPCRHKGKNINASISQVQYVDTSAKNVLGIAGNLIPFVSHNDGARTLMGTNMQKQAITVKNREAPLVTTLKDKASGKTYDEAISDKYAKPVLSNANGTVVKITDDSIVIKDDKGNTHSHSYYNYYPLNQSFINNDLKVKVGDKVKKGGMLAEGWQSKDGKLALGVNTRVGYLPFKGHNYEDAVVISKSYAKKMATDEVEEVTVEVPDGWIGGRNSGIQKKLDAYTSNPEVKTKLDSDGIVKKGTEVKPGSILVAMLRPISADSDSLLDIIQSSDKEQKYEYKPATIESTSYIHGKIIRVTIISGGGNVKQKIVFTIAHSEELKFGDKISGRHGNKGTIAKILPDNEMPCTSDGKPLDLLFSPLAVPSRKNVGQLYEVNAGLIAEKTGKRFVVDNFNHNEPERIKKELAKIGCPDGKTDVFLQEYDEKGKPIKVKVENPVTVGNMYVMKLKHKVDDKVQSRSNLETAPDRKTNMPSKVVGANKGEKHNPQSLGEMEMRALQGHGAVWNALESSTIKADGGGDRTNRIAIYNALATGKLDSEDLNTSATPETLNVLSDNLKALGLNVRLLGKNAKNSFDNAYDSLAISPMKSSEMLKIIGEKNEVTKHDLFNARDMYDAKKDKNGVMEKAKGIEGGLLDPKIFGEEGTDDNRKKWGYIKLATPVANPVLMQNASYNPYATLTNMSSEKLKALMGGKKVLIIDPDKYTGYGDMKASDKAAMINSIKKAMKDSNVKAGDLISPSELESLMNKHGQMLWKAGGEGLQHMLDNIDLNKELANAKKQLDEAKGTGIDKAYKRFKMLSTLKKNDMQPSDLMMKYVPVMPMHLRPVTPNRESGQMIIDDMNKLYSNLIKANNPAKLSIDNGYDILKSLPPTEAAKTTGNIYNKLANITGNITGKDAKTKRQLKGIGDIIGRKEGLIRSKMLSKRTDFSGRSVIGVDPNLKIDEMGVPVDMAKYVYKPFIMKELVQHGYAKNQIEAKKKWEKLDTDTKTVLKDIVKDRPLILNRQPSLHKYSIQALKPVLKEEQDGAPIRSIQLNPLVVTGFNADFDGDTMAIHVPITERAKEEAKALMMPSQNLINPTNGSMMIELRHEMVLGIYQLTSGWNKGVGKTKQYTSYQKLKKDYLTGKITSKQLVSIGGLQNVTAGQALFNLLIPTKFRDTKKAWNSKSLNAMLMQLYKDAEKDDFKKMSKAEISAIIDRIKKLGFESSTKSGVSIGISDFKNIDTSHIFKKSIDDAKKKFGDTEEAQIAGWQQGEKAVEKMLKTENVLGDDNALKIMMESGARAKPDQIRRMLVSVGVGRDVNQKLLTPIKESHFDGLSPEDYFKLGFDSRKGIMDRSVSTSDPGALSREVWSATQDMVITEEDCKTIEGVTISKNDKSLLGRYAAKDIVGSNNQIICRRNQIINNDMVQKIYKDEKIKTVEVRSPLKCKTVHGICQKCYGALSGTIQPVKLGTAVGVLASQALGEPVTQMTMNTFHSGGANASATLGLPRIKDILGMKTDDISKASLATVTGKITKIVDNNMSTVVYINDKPQEIKHDLNNKPKQLRVKVGDTVTKGDFLTKGNSQDILVSLSGSSDDVLTNADPQNMFKLKSTEFGNDKALHDTRSYLTNTMQYAFEKTVPNSLDRRHMETIITKLTNKVKILDAGDSPLTKGQIVEKNLADKWNAENGTAYSGKNIPVSSINQAIGSVLGKTYKHNNQVIAKNGDVLTKEVAQKILLSGTKTVHVLPKPIQYESQLFTKDTAATKGHDNWFSNLGHKDVFTQVARGATMGQIDKLNDPRSRLMTGKLMRLGSGFNTPKPIADNISTKMLNFFSKIPGLHNK